MNFDSVLILGFDHIFSFLDYLILFELEELDSLEGKNLALAFGFIDGPKSTLANFPDESKFSCFS